MSDATNTVPPSPWWNVEQGAAYLQISVTTFFRECRAGRIKCARVGGRRNIRVKQGWLDSYMESCVEASS